MFRKQECVAMLLAGGQGSRLYALTRNHRQAGGALMGENTASSIFPCPTVSIPASRRWGC